MAHLLTDEAFALSIGHFRRVGADRRTRLLDRGDRRRRSSRGTSPPSAGSSWAAQIPDPTRFGIDIIFPAAMIGLAVGLITGAASSWRRSSGPRSASSSRCSPSAVGRDHHGRAGRAAGRPARAGRRGPRDRAARDAELGRALRDAGHAHAARATPASRPPDDERRMSTDLVLLAVLMFAVTYPSRALGLLTPGMDRLPDSRPRLPPARRAGRAHGHRRGQRHGPRRPTTATPSFHVGIEWLAVLACLGDRRVAHATCCSGSSVARGHRRGGARRRLTSLPV